MFRGGQNALGLAGAALAFAVLRGLRRLEQRITERRGATLSAQWRQESLDLAELKTGIAAANLTLVRLCVAQDAQAGTAEVRCGLSYAGDPRRHGPPVELVSLLQRVGALKWDWAE